MSLKDKASLIFKPSRYKSGTAYSFRGEDFTFTRSSVATRINSEGNIEEVASGVPRLNYDVTDLTKCPNLLLEYQKTNLIYQSQNLSAWSAVNCSVTSNSTTSPEGIVNSFRITENSATSTQHRVVLGSIGGSSAIYTISAYVKNSNGNRMAYIDMGPVTAHFNFLTETIYSGAGTAGFENIGNGWYRIWVTSNSAVSVVSCFAGLSVNNNETYSGDGSSAIEFYGLQLEAGSYPTSLIKTAGSTATRSSDFAESTFADNTIAPTNNTTVYFEVKIDGKIDDIPNTGGINFKNNAGTLNRLNFNYGYNRVYSNFVTGSTTQFIASSDVKEGDILKVVMQLTQGGKAFVNGKHTHTATRDFSSLTLGQLEFDHSQGVLEYLIFPQILSDAECESLSGYDSYQELVDRNELTWESPTITNNRLTALQEL